MNLLVVASSFLILQLLHVTAETGCDGELIREVCHEEKILTTGYFKNSLIVDYSSDKLYFIQGWPQANVALYDLQTGRINEVPKWKFDSKYRLFFDPFYLALNQNSHLIYVSSWRGGIDVYNAATEEHSEIILKEQDANQAPIFFKDDKLYYFDVNTYNLYANVDGISSIYVSAGKLNLEQFKSFLIDKDGDVFFIKDESCSVYHFKIALNRMIEYSKLCAYNEQELRMLAMDVHGNGYVCARDGIHEIVKTENVELKHIASKTCYGLAFDKHDNVIISSFPRHLFQYTPKCNKIPKSDSNTHIKENCDGALIRGVYYEKERLTNSEEEQVEKTHYELSVDYQTDILYYTVKKTYWRGYSRTAHQYDMKTKIHNKLKCNDWHSNSPVSVTVDQNDHVIYLADEDGYFYIHNSTTDNFDRFGQTDTGIRTIFFKDRLFFIDGGINNVLYTYKNSNVYSEKLTEIRRNVNKFIIDKDGDEFFRRLEIAPGLYYVKYLSGKPVKVKTGCLSYMTLATDVQGNAYVCADDGIYAIVKNNAIELSKIAAIPCDELAFDSQNNLIVAYKEHLYRYKPGNETCVDLETNTGTNIQLDDEAKFNNAIW